MVPKGAPVSRFQNPTVLVTRPQDSSLRFIEALSVVKSKFEPIIAPAFEIVATSATVPEFETAVFTSQAGVLFAPPGRGRRAYCVGDTTAVVAQEKGFDAVSAKGSADDLTSLILTKLPKGKILHIRGEVSVGNVAGKLRGAGLDCEELIAYRKQPMPLDSLLKDRISSANALVIPLFSAETVSIISNWSLDLSRAYVVAISGVVSDAAQDLKPVEIVTSPTPDMEAMVATTSRLIA